jgi:hypothetical protein
VLAVSRIDAAAQREYLVLTNSSTSARSVAVQTSTPSSSWSVLFGGATAPTSDAAGRLRVTVPAVGALLLEATKQIPASRPPKPLLHVAGDGLTNLWAVSAKIAGTAPVTVAFACRRAGSKAWRRLDVDDSPPYRAFLDPTKFKKNERLQLVAIARSLHGSTATSAVVGFRVHGR